MNTDFSITLATRTDCQLRHLPAFMEHHMPYCNHASILIDLRPDQTADQILSYLESRWAGLYTATILESCEFSNAVNIPTLQSCVEQGPRNTWVLHLDKDEFVSRPHLIPSIVSTMEQNGHHYSEGWMACRFGPAMKLYSDDLPDYDSFRKAAPVRAEYIKAYGFPTRKVWLGRWPHVFIHHAFKGWSRHPDLMAIDHFTWTNSRLHFLKEKLFWHLKTNQCETIANYVQHELEAIKGSEKALKVVKDSFIPISCGLKGFFDYADVYRKIVDEAPEGATIVELGVYCGRSLCYLGEYATLTGKKLDIVGVDLFDLCEHSLSDLHPPFLTHEEHLAGVQAACEKFSPWNVPRLIKSDTAEAASLFEDGSVFAVWVDAGHDEASVISDLTAWLPKVAPGGIFAGHDLAPSHPGVLKGLTAVGIPHRPISARSWIMV
jgi:hypothetical protein